MTTKIPFTTEDTRLLKKLLRQAKNDADIIHKIRNNVESSDKATQLHKSSARYQITFNKVNILQREGITANFLKELDFLMKKYNVERFKYESDKAE